MRFETPRAARLQSVWLWLAATLVAGMLAGTFPAVGQARDYAIDAEASQLRIRVLRTGTFSVLAHNHILVAKGISGRVSFNAESVAASSAGVSVPVAFLEIDDPKERVREGAGFEAELNDSNRASVRENMLGTAQLDVAQFPRVTIVIDRAEGSLPTLKLHARIKIRDREQAVILPATVSVDSGTLIVSGETDLLQSAFGITPYTALFGAIAVQDSVHIKFQIVARSG